MDDGHATTTPIGPEEGASAPAPGAMPRVGDVIAERYRVDSIIGKGGMGVVLKVTHLQLGEPYAIKFLRPDTEQDAEMVERFLREARAAVRIKSDHIARVNDVGRLADGSPFILMEYLVGRDLASVLGEGPLPIQHAVEYVLQACAGVAEAHALGIVHRDLKPSNLFLTERSDGAPLVKVLDFGIAKAMDGHSSSSAAVTLSTSAFGSPAFMSPEQVRSFKRVDFRTDVWSLGVILFQLLTDELPFEAENVPGLLAAITADEPLRVRKFRPEVPEALDVIVRDCIERDLAKRIQSVRELAERLQPLVGDTVVSLGRIQRVSARADSGRGAASPSNPSPSNPSPSTPKPTAEEEAPTVAVDFDGPTERAITSPTDAPPATEAPRARSSTVLIVAGVLVGSAVAIGAVLAFRSPAAGPASPIATSVAPASAAPSAIPSAPASAADAPTVVAAPSASASSASMQRSATPPRRPASSAKPSTAPSPAVSSSTLPSVPKADPTAESH